MIRRRDFLARVAISGAGLFGASLLGAQQPAAGQGSGNLFDMDQSAAKTVRKPPRRDAVKSMTDEQRDALERDVRCQCGCTLDVYICRTTDFSCQVSPAMHRDIISLVEGGYSAQEILDSFVTVYGERALMAPRRSGFNWAGYLVPFAALGIGAIALTTVLRGMQRRPGSAARVAPDAPDVTATDDEMSRLAAAIRKDE
ncbi:MAG: cytochrome biosis protein [Gemmatimonadetes bacterium]|nr:cytochrome biosis protein [Gemmatimonadota bacterium]